MRRGSRRSEQVTTMAIVPVSPKPFLHRLSCFLHISFVERIHVNTCHYFKLSILCTETSTRPIYLLKLETEGVHLTGSIRAPLKSLNVPLKTMNLKQMCPLKTQRDSFVGNSLVYGIYVVEISAYMLKYQHC